MESRGKRTPRMTAPAEIPAPQHAAEISDPVKIEAPAEESIPEREMVAEHIAPPAPAADALPEPLPAPAQLPAPVPPPAADNERDLFAAITQSRAALARGVGSISDEFASLARHSIDATAHTAIEILGVRTWADAVAVNASFARTSFDHWLDSTAKVSELGVQLAVESSKVFVSRLGIAWSGAQQSRR